MELVRWPDSMPVWMFRSSHLSWEHSTCGGRTASRETAINDFMKMGMAWAHVATWLPQSLPAELHDHGNSVEPMSRISKHGSSLSGTGVVQQFSKSQSPPKESKHRMDCGNCTVVLSANGRAETRCGAREWKTRATRRGRLLSLSVAKARSVSALSEGKGLRACHCATHAEGSGTERRQQRRLLHRGRVSIRRSVPVCHSE